MELMQKRLASSKNTVQTALNKSIPCITQLVGNQAIIQKMENPDAFDAAFDALMLSPPSDKKKHNELIIDVPSILDVTFEFAVLTSGGKSGTHYQLLVYNKDDDNCLRFSRSAHGDTIHYPASYKTSKGSYQFQEEVKLSEPMSLEKAIQIGKNITEKEQKYSEVYDCQWYAELVLNTIKG